MPLTCGHDWMRLALLIAQQPMHEGSAQGVSGATAMEQVSRDTRSDQSGLKSVTRSNVVMDPILPGGPPGSHSHEQLWHHQGTQPTSSDQGTHSADQ